MCVCVCVFVCTCIQSSHLDHRVFVNVGQADGGVGGVADAHENLANKEQWVKTVLEVHNISYMVNQLIVSYNWFIILLIWANHANKLRAALIVLDSLI